jgi:hypothetical protein
MPSQTSPGTTVNVPSSNHIGAIVGGIIGGLTALLAILTVWYWCWRKRRRAQEDLSSKGDFDPQPQFTSFAGTVSTSESPPSPRTGEAAHTKRRHIYSIRGERMGHVHESSFSSSDQTILPRNSATVRREADAGPLSSQNAQSEEYTLPPEYEQVFRGTEGRENKGQPQIDDRGPKA